MDRWEPVQNVIEFVSLMILLVQCMQEGGIKQRAQFGLDRKFVTNSYCIACIARLRCSKIMLTEFFYGFINLFIIICYLNKGRDWVLFMRGKLAF